jgi:hypothetical protein
MAIQLEVLNINAYRRFHADYVACRMFTTYEGQATQ